MSYNPVHNQKIVVERESRVIDKAYSTELDFMNKQNTELALKNPELLSKNPVTVHKYETTVYEVQPGINESFIQKQKDLEFELAEARQQIQNDAADLASLRLQLAMFPELQEKIKMLESENVYFKNELGERLRELDFFRIEKNETLQKDQMIIAQQAKLIEDLEAKISGFGLYETELLNSRNEITRLSAEVTRLNDLLRNKDFEVSRFTSTISELETKIQVLNTSLVRFEGLDAEIFKLREMIIALTQDRDRLVNELGFRDNIIVNLRKELTKVSTDLQIQTDLLKKNEALVASLAALQKELQVKEFKIAELTKLWSEGRSNEQCLHETIKSITIERDTSIEKISKLKAELDAFNVERTKFADIIRQKDIEISELTTSLNQIIPELDNASTKISTLRVEIRRLEDLLTAKQLEIKDLTSSYVKFEGIMFETDRYRSQVEMLLREKETFLQVLSNKDREIAALKNDLVSLTRELQSMDIDVETFKRKTMAIDTVRMELNARDKEVDDFYHKQEDWKDKEARLMDMIKKLEADKTSQFHKIEDLIAQISMIAPERDNLVRLLSQKESAIRDLSARVSMLTRENDELRKALTELQRMRDEFSISIHERELEINRLSKLLDQTNIEFSSMKERIDFYDPEVLRLNSLIKQQENEFISLRKQLHNATQVENRMDYLSMRNSQLKSELESTDMMKSEIYQLRQNLDALIVERDRMTKLLQERELELERLRPFVSDYELMRTRLAEYEAEIEKLSNFVGQEDTYIRKLQAEMILLKENEASRSLLIAENKKFAEENIFLSNKVQELEQSLTIITTKFTKLESSYLQIRNAAHLLDNVHTKLVDVCESTERIEPVVQTVVSKNTSTFSEKTDIKSSSQLKQQPMFTQPERF